MCVCPWRRVLHPYQVLRASRWRAALNVCVKPVEKRAAASCPLPHRASERFATPT